MFRKEGRPRKVPERNVVVLSRHFEENVQLVAKMCLQCYKEEEDVKIIGINRKFIELIDRREKETHKITEAHTQNDTAECKGTVSSCMAREEMGLHYHCAAGGKYFNDELGSLEDAEVEDCSLETVQYTTPLQILEEENTCSSLVGRHEEINSNIQNNKHRFQNTVCSLSGEEKILQFYLQAEKNYFDDCEDSIYSLETEEEDFEACSTHSSSSLETRRNTTSVCKEKKEFIMSNNNSVGNIKDDFEESSLDTNITIASPQPGEKNKSSVETDMSTVSSQYSNKLMDVYSEDSIFSVKNSESNSYGFMETKCVINSFRPLDTNSPQQEEQTTKCVINSISALDTTSPQQEEENSSSVETETQDEEVNYKQISGNVVEADLKNRSVKNTVVDFEANCYGFKETNTITAPLLEEKEDFIINSLPSTDILEETGSNDDNSTENCINLLQPEENCLEIEEDASVPFTFLLNLENKKENSTEENNERVFAIDNENESVSSSASEIFKSSNEDNFEHVQKNATNKIMNYEKESMGNEENLNHSDEETVLSQYFNPANDLEENHKEEIEIRKSKEDEKLVTKLKNLLECSKRNTEIEANVNLSTEKSVSDEDCEENLLINEKQCVETRNDFVTNEVCREEWKEDIDSEEEIILSQYFSQDSQKKSDKELDKAFKRMKVRRSKEKEDLTLNNDQYLEEETKEIKKENKKTNVKKKIKSSVESFPSTSNEKSIQKTSKRKKGTNVIKNKRKKADEEIDMCSSPKITAEEIEKLSTYAIFQKRISRRRFLTPSEDDQPSCAPPGALVPLWTPPRSPHGLIEEDYFRNPWGLLVASIFLNKTSGKQAKPYIDSFLKDHPSAEDVVKKTPAELEVYFEELGLRKRAETIWKMSSEFLKKSWRHARELHGIGKYGDDAFRMFCLGDLEVEPSDRYLKIYHAWVKKWIETNPKDDGNNVNTISSKIPGTITFIFFCLVDYVMLVL